ncbi:hypothetical protein KFL_001820200 [Klebsormidium nitens]|uniref:Uncharacterized protein n=1 Tax=Klebsormidium nitens TaxID=105231 RepID=A0A1Y1I6B7_KLENI|nr:hypothetical protein KFL_001820200 [Klebsormidium nitens]|eukprot:GAQ84267.1 hypothetical protein KFL_001820200 [Klebsormidium nitens]
MEQQLSLLPIDKHGKETLGALHGGKGDRKAKQASGTVSSVVKAPDARRSGKVFESQIVQEGSRQQEKKALQLNVKESKKGSKVTSEAIRSAKSAKHITEQAKKQKEKVCTIRQDENTEAVRAAQEGKEAAELYVKSQERQLAGEPSRKGKGKKKQRKMSSHSMEEKPEEDAGKDLSSRRTLESALMSSAAPSFTSAIRLAKKGKLQSSTIGYFYKGKSLAEEPCSHDFVAEKFFEGSLSTGHTVYVFANCCGQLGWPPRGKDADSGPFTYKPCDHSRSLPTFAYHPGHLLPNPADPGCRHGGHWRGLAVRESAPARLWSCCLRPLGAPGCARRTDLFLERLIEKRQFRPAGDDVPPTDEIFECAAYLTLLEATRGDSSTADWAKTVVHGVDECSEIDWEEGRELLRRVLAEKEAGGLSEDFWVRLDMRLRMWGCRADLAALEAGSLLQLYRISVLLSKHDRRRAAALMKGMEDEGAAGERPEARACAPESGAPSWCVCGAIEGDPNEEREFLEKSVKEIEKSLDGDASTIRELEPDEDTLKVLESLQEIWKTLKGSRDKKKMAWQHKMMMRRKICHLVECRQNSVEAMGCEVRCLPAYERPTDDSAKETVVEPDFEPLLDYLVLHEYLASLSTLPEATSFCEEMATLTAVAEQMESEELAQIMQPLEAMALAGDAKAEEISDHLYRHGIQGLASLATLSHFYGHQRFANDPRVAAALNLIGAQLDTWTFVQRGSLRLLAAAARGAPDARLRLFASVFAGAPFEESVRALRGVWRALQLASDELSPQVMCTIVLLGEDWNLEGVAEVLLRKGEGSEASEEEEPEERVQAMGRGKELPEDGRRTEGGAGTAQNAPVKASISAEHAGGPSNPIKRSEGSALDSSAETERSSTEGQHGRAAERPESVPRAAAGEEGLGALWEFSDSDIVQLRLLTEVSNFEPVGAMEEAVWEKLKKTASGWTEKMLEEIFHFCGLVGLKNVSFSRVAEYVQSAGARLKEDGHPTHLSLLERAERMWLAARAHARGGSLGAGRTLRRLCAEFLKSLVEDIDVEGGVGPGEPPHDVFILFTLFAMLLYAREPESQAIWQRIMQAQRAAEQSGVSVSELEQRAERGRMEELREEAENEGEEEEEVGEDSEVEAESGIEAHAEIEAKGEIEAVRQVFDRVQYGMGAAGFAGQSHLSESDISSNYSESSWLEFVGEDGGIQSPTETEDGVGETPQRDRTETEGNRALLEQLAARVGGRRTEERFGESVTEQVRADEGASSTSVASRLDRSLNCRNGEGLRVHEAGIPPVEYSLEDSDEGPKSGSSRAFSSRRSRPAIRVGSVCKEGGGANSVVLDMASLD